MENKYQQGKIYKIMCNISNEIYIGSTILELNIRLDRHKSRRSCICRQIIERDNYKIELIKDYPCNSKWELEEEEKKYILENKCINKFIPNRTKKEYYEDNKEHTQEYQKQYYINNKKEKIKTHKTEHIKCECGALVAKNNIARHRKTNKHIKLTECIILD